jgi:2-polyprenyl-6-methoxyphenol hydroxylase-like FAD-dependent oxidoreductase
MSERISVECCIAGGGPAGMMLGLLLARAGVKTMVLEKHADFLRDFRGDTVHPSTLQVMYELGLLDRFLAVPHSRVEKLTARFGTEEFTIADFKHLPTHCHFLAIMPQWDFLNFVATESQRYPTYQLRMQTEVTDLIEEEGTIVGLRAVGPDGPLEVRAPLVVGANGRGSPLPEKAGLTLEEIGVPMDVFWFRLSRLPSDGPQMGGTFRQGQILVLIPREGHWQVGYVISKGSADRIRAAGLDAFRETIARLAPFAHERIKEITSWDQVKLLTVRINRLDRWCRPGLLFIGDAAHAMSPVGGVGINLAIQDAVAAANAVAEPLRLGRLTIRDLERVERRRTLPTRLTQRLQMAMQEVVIRPQLAGRNGAGHVPFGVRMLGAFPPLRTVLAYVIGVGIRTEHVRASPVRRSRTRSPSTR